MTSNVKVLESSSCHQPSGSCGLSIASDGRSSSRAFTSRLPLCQAKCTRSGIGEPSSFVLLVPRTATEVPMHSGVSPERKPDSPGSGASSKAAPIFSGSKESFVITTSAKLPPRPKCAATALLAFANSRLTFRVSAIVSSDTCTPGEKPVLSKALKRVMNSARFPLLRRSWESLKLGNAALVLSHQTLRSSKACLVCTSVAWACAKSSITMNFARVCDTTCLGMSIPSDMVPLRASLSSPYGGSEQQPPAPDYLLPFLFSDGHSNA
mmetsp:Transcript_120533/g.384891  ORF Transcript_120533/g.384891 Transcript_120533/m.384891 type:complete len:266 (-) Transcript_120533:82-879(-)